MVTGMTQQKKQYQFFTNKVMMQIRCKNCNRLLYVQTGEIKQIKSDKITYNISGKIEIFCKCNYLNK